MFDGFYDQKAKMVLKIWIVYLPLIHKIMTTWDHGTLPIQFLSGEKLTYLHVKTIILAQNLWISILRG